MPQNGGAFWDGQRFWFFYSEHGELKAKFGPSLMALGDTPTQIAGRGNVRGLVNDKTFSLAFGKFDGQWHAWALTNRTRGQDAEEGGTAFDVFSWRLDETGLTQGRERAIRIGDKFEPSHVTLMPDIAGDDWEVRGLLGAVTGRPSKSKGGHDIAVRRIAPDLSSDTGLGGVSMSGVKFPEAAWTFRLRDGYVLNAINIGDWPPPPPRPAAFSEWRRDVLDHPWSVEHKLETDEPDGWRDTNYARDTSHAGQSDFVQLADGSVFNAYLDDADRDAGNFGRVILKRRGPNLADRWSTVTTDAMGEGGEEGGGEGGGRAWHVALTCDGRRVWLLYVADDGGKRSNAITFRGYDPAADRWTLPVAIARVTPTASTALTLTTPTLSESGGGASEARGQSPVTLPPRRFDRMTVPRRFAAGRLVVLWSQTNGEGTWWVYATAVRVGQAGDTRR